MLASPIHCDLICTSEHLEAAAVSEEVVIDRSSAVFFSHEKKEQSVLRRGGEAHLLWAQARLTSLSSFR